MSRDTNQPSTNHTGGQSSSDSEDEVAESFHSFKRKLETDEQELKNVIGIKSDSKQAISANLTSTYENATQGQNLEEDEKDVERVSRAKARMNLNAETLADMLSSPNSSMNRSGRVAYLGISCCCLLIFRVVVY